MGDNYKKFAFVPKNLTDGGSIGGGEINFQHLDPALFAEIRNIQLHKHTGNGSTRVKFQDLDGYMPSIGFTMFSSDGTKKYQVTIDSATDSFVITQVT